MARVTLDAVEQQERLICVEKEAIADDGEALFDDNNQPLPRWAGIEKLLNEYEADLERTRQMSERLSRCGLLEPFSMQATPNGGAPLSMTGMFRVDEARLARLAESDLRDLLSSGVLARVYAHLLSLDNFGRLLDRRAAAGA
jgi:hypothetical protein